MEDVGVKAVVENVNGFLSDIKKVNVSVENFAEKVFDIGTSVGSAHLEKLGIGILDVGSALSNIHPAIKVAFVAFQEIGREIKVLANDLKTVFKTAWDIAVKAIKGFASVIKTVLSPARKVIDVFVGSLKRIGEIATGIIIANTVRKLTNTISEMATSALDAAINFQTLEVRLQGLAARQIYNEGGVSSFEEALGQASGKAEELLDWVVQLSLKAPISTDAIANTLTLATSYGLGEEKAKNMTKAVLEFASGMGLSDVAMRRIIENFGQMIQQTKITSMELRDMGRGAFVPVNDLLNKTADLLGLDNKALGITAATLNDFAKEAGLDPTMTIMEAFIEMVETQFPGAIERMGSTISGIRQRFKNLTNALVGLFILKPSIDLLGSSISDIFDKIAESEKIQSVSKEIGTALAEIVEELLGEMPSVETIVTKIETALENVRDALGLFKEGDFFGGLATLGVPQGVIDFLESVKGFAESEKVTTFIDNVTTGFQNLRDFWDTNKETIMDALRTATGEIFDALGLETPENGGGGFLEWTENLDVEDVLLKIDQVTTGILNFIQAIKDIKTTWEENKPVILAIGLLFLALAATIRAPFLGLIMFLPFAVGAALGAASLVIEEKLGEWFLLGADIIANLLDGMGEWWDEKVVPWIQGVVSWAAAQLAKIGIGGGGGGNSSTTSTPMQGATSSSSSSQSSVVNNTVNMGPIMQRTQTASRMRDDVAVMLGGVS